MHPHLQDAAEFFGHVLHHLTQCRAQTAPSSPFDGVPNQLTQLLKGQATMAIDLSKLAAELPQAIAALQQLPQVQAQLAAAQAANADLSTKLANAPHDDPTVQASVDQMASSLQAALDQLSAVSTAAGNAPASMPSEPTTTTPPADTTATPAPVTTAPAETDTPSV